MLPTHLPAAHSVPTLRLVLLLAFAGVVMHALLLARLLSVNELGLRPVELFAASSSWTLNVASSGGGRPEAAPAQLLRPQADSYVALCVFAKDEHPHIREWLLYHHLLGVNKFYVWDDGSTVPMQGVLQDFIDAGLVEYTFLLAPPPNISVDKQDSAYQLCLERYSGRHQFIGFIDVDEFVVLHEAEEGSPPYGSQGAGAGAQPLGSLPAFLSKFEAFGGVYLFQKLYGSSGHVMRPAAGVLQSYTKCCPVDDRWGKMFTRTAATLSTAYVHGLRLKERSVPVDTLGREFLQDLPLSRQRLAAQRATLSHYVTRSAQDFQAKAQRGGGSGLNPPRNASYFEQIEAQCTLSCGEGPARAAALRWAFGRLLAPPPPPLLVQ